MEKKRFAIVGCGHLGNIVTDAWVNGLLPEYDLVGVLGRGEEHAKAMAAKAGCKACTDLAQLLALRPDYVAEMAGVQAVKDMALPVLAGGANLVVLSIGAFADAGFYREVREAARAHKVRVHIASGAIGGFDVLRTLSLMGGVKARMVTRKGPESLMHSPLFAPERLRDTQETEVFAGSAKDAIALLPTRVNVSVAAALASAGPENLDFHIFSVPGMVGDDHRILAGIDGVKAEVDIYSATSDIAGWSVVALLQNLVSPVCF